MQIYLKDENDLSDHFCEKIVKCDGEIQTEDSMEKCHGCTAMDEFMDKHYSDILIDEQKETQFLSLIEVKKELESLRDRMDDTRDYQRVQNIIDEIYLIKQKPENKELGIKEE